MLTNRKMLFLGLATILCLFLTFKTEPKQLGSTGLIRSSQPEGRLNRVVPYCSTSTYATVIRQFSEHLSMGEKQRLVSALGSLDAWYNMNAKASGLTMTEEDTIQFLAGAVCGKGYTLEKIEMIAQGMIGGR